MLGLRHAAPPGSQSLHGKHASVLQAAALNPTPRGTDKTAVLAHYLSGAGACHAALLRAQQGSRDTRTAVANPKSGGAVTRTEPSSLLEPPQQQVVMLGEIVSLGGEVQSSPHAIAPALAAHGGDTSVGVQPDREHAAGQQADSMPAQASQAPSAPLPSSMDEQHADGGERTSEHQPCCLEASTSATSSATKDQSVSASTSEGGTAGDVVPPAEPHVPTDTAAAPVKPRAPRKPRPPPPYASAQHNLYKGPWKLKGHKVRPPFLEKYPVPPGRTYNINSFLGDGEVHSGKYFVSGKQYNQFLQEYCDAYHQGYQLFLTEAYHKQFFRYFLELDFDWDMDLTLLMRVTEQLLPLLRERVRSFYGSDSNFVVTCIRSPYKVHLNFPGIITTELLAHMCRDQLIEACKAELDTDKEFSLCDIDWERIIDFPHGSFRLPGSTKTLAMVNDPDWVYDKVYHPAALIDGKWRPAGITTQLLKNASILPTEAQISAFERSELYLDVIFTDYGVYQEKLKERQKQRELRRAAAAALAGVTAEAGSNGGRSGGGGGGGGRRQRAGRRLVTLSLEVQEDGYVACTIAPAPGLVAAAAAEAVAAAGVGAAPRTVSHASTQPGLPSRSTVVDGSEGLTRQTASEGVPTCAHDAVAVPAAAAAPGQECSDSPAAGTGGCVLPATDSAAPSTAAGLA